ncbi:Peroxiredoxin [Alkalithermobacter thermoalcaliphilus JW-YL-7 = DSM 7308]|uniref:Alkyl hydroperoxide reductase/ Thiol specific antioxidant/ Mal allergen n=1 Tax=Alkalithermobacter thermoalcaliphilus JW-YL-7 = DSM 7308 TaxID=1121328 RepID=A0A150FTY3_CLOPD|nr:alkyl hydroperoxide reductase/ Thiol specific antioxidant/ Mal allergen [[Clostridium] paradoxum JW-YL-7 = DSM 7308]SHL20006.1 Peroxiredoxin [[Clostridium] paradoxum JW-YL-7 = DSM 7308]
MKRFILFLFLIIFMISSVGCEKKEKQTITEDKNIQYGIHEGNKAYDFILTDSDGKKVALSDFKGEKVFLNFWASWCKYCEIDKQKIASLQDEYKNIKFLMVNLTELEKINKDQIRDYLFRYSKDFVLLYDDESYAASIYSVAAIPTSYIIDEEGIIRKMIVGPITNRLEEEIRQLLDN